MDSATVDSATVDSVTVDSVTVDSVTMGSVTMGLVCFRLKASDDATRALVEAINNSGFAFLSQTTVDGKFTIRLAIGTFGCTWEDLTVVWQRILSVVE